MLTLNGIVAKEFAGISLGCNRCKRVKKPASKEKVAEETLEEGLSATLFSSKRDETYPLL